MQTYFFINHNPYQVHFPLGYKLFIKTGTRLVKERYNYSKEVIRILTALKKPYHKQGSKYINKEVHKHKYIQINNQTNSNILPKHK